MRVALVTHQSSLEHRGPPHHPERPDRVQAAVEGVEQSVAAVVDVTARPVERDTLLAVHDEGFVDALERFCAAGGGAIDYDTFAVPASWEAALNAAGAGASAVQALSSGDADVAFVAMRPPGHHAGRSRAMGFCLFNNVAVTAAALVADGQRVAIVDWDVHHGNGTQDLFFTDPAVLYVSLHQHPFYPGTGFVAEVGRGPAAGTTVNVPMPRGAGGMAYREAFDAVVEPVLGQFGADWLLVSAGYDAHRRDPLAEIELLEGDYSAMAEALARAVPNGRTVYFLEGGYDLEAVRDSVAATLNGHTGVASPSAPVGEGLAAETVAQIVETLGPYWDVG